VGLLWTLLLVVGTGFLGAWLAREQGLAVWKSIQDELTLGRFPADNLIDGLLLLIAGAVLLTPGLLTDLLGFSILFPGTRRTLRTWVKRKLKKMMDSGNVSLYRFLS